MPKYHVVESIHIDAPVERVFQTVLDFGTWARWSPWLISDPQANVTVSSNASSVGSRYAWRGTVTGEGEIVHEKVEPCRLIEDRLEFIKPFASKSKVLWELSPSSNGTQLTWSMDSALPWFLFLLVPTMKTFLGMDFRRGLTMLKDWIESGSIPSRCVVHGIESLEPMHMAGIVGSASVDSVGTAMEKSLEEAAREFRRQGLSMDGPVVSVYTRFRVAEKRFEYLSGYVLPPSSTVEPVSPLKRWSLPSKKAFRVEHIGSYRHLGNGWSVANQLARHQKLRQCTQGTFEIYRNSPQEVPEDELRTDIYLPVK